MYSTFTYLCDVLINPFRSVSAKEALPTPEDRSVASQPSSFSSPNEVHRSHPTSSSSKTVVSSPAVAAHRRFMQHSASTDTTGKLSRNQSRKAAAKAKASAKLSTAVTPVTSSSTSDVTASVEHAQEDDQHREKRKRLNVPATPAILKQHNGTLPIPHAYLDHLAHAEATAAHLRSLNPPAPLFAPLVVTPPIYYNVVTPTVQTPSPALANYLGLERPAGNTQEQELKRKRIGSLIQTLIKHPAEPRTPTQLPPQPRPVTHFVSAQPTAASKPPLTPSNESPSPALPDYVRSNSPLSSSTTPPTNIKDTNELADIIPTAKQSCSPERSPNVLMGMTWYPELPCTANGNQEMMRLVDRDGLLHTLTRKNSPVFDAINLLLQTQGLQAEHSLNHTHINTPNDPSSPHTVNEGSSSAISSSPTAVSEVPTLEPSTDPYILDVDDSEESESVSSVSAAASAEAQNFFSSSADQALVNKQVQMDGDHGQGHAPGNLTLAPCSVPASVLTDAVGSEASNVDEVLSLERCHTTRGDKQSSVAGEVERPDQSLDGVDFAALFMLSASAAHIPAPLCFVGLFKKGSEFIEATFTLRAHRRRGNVWWLLVETLTGSDLVANFAFGPGTVMSYANDGWVDFTVLPVSSRNILKNRYFVTDQDTASQIAELLRRSIEVYFPSSAHPNATKTPDAPSDLLTAQSYVQADVGGALADGPLSLLTSQMVHQTYPETAVPEALVGNGKADEGLPTAVERSSTLAETTGVARSWIAPAVSSKTVEHNENPGLDKSAEDTAPEDLATTNQDLDKATTTIDTDVVIVDADVNAIDITAAHLEPASFAADVTAPVDTVMDDHEAATSQPSSIEDPILQDDSAGASVIVEDDMGLPDYEEDDEMAESTGSPGAGATEDMDQSDSAALPIPIFIPEPADNTPPPAIVWTNDIAMDYAPAFYAPHASSSLVTLNGPPVTTSTHDLAQRMSVSQALTSPSISQSTSTPGNGGPTDIVTASHNGPLIDAMREANQSNGVPGSTSSAPQATALPTAIDSSPPPSAVSSPDIATENTIAAAGPTTTGLVTNTAGGPVESYAVAGSLSSSNRITVTPAPTVVSTRAASNPSSSMATTSFNATAESPILGQGFRSAAFTTMLPPNYLADDEEDDDYEEQLRAPRHWEGEDDNPTTATWRIGAPRIAQPIDIAESFISDAVISHDINKVARNLASGVISRRRRAAEMNDDF